MTYRVCVTSLLRRTVIGYSVFSLTLAPLPTMAMIGNDYENTLPAFSFASELGYTSSALTTKIHNGFQLISSDKSWKSKDKKSGTGLAPWLLVGGLAFGVALAAGGGGDDNDAILMQDPVGPQPSPSPLPTPTPSPSPSPVKKINPAEFETREYRRDYSLGLINASSRYADGGTGKGKLLAVFDTGIDASHVDLAGQIAHKRSYFYADDQHVADYHRHGTHVASSMVGIKNDFGNHGVAFDAKLAVFQGLSWNGGPSMRKTMSEAFADAHDASIGLGAVAINHSWGYIHANGKQILISEFTSKQALTNFLGSEIIDALKRSVKGNLISVFAAGNDAKADVAVLAGVPVYFSEFRDHVIAVVAVDSDAEIASFSHRCGIAADFCLAAPGQDIIGAASSNAGYGRNQFIYMDGTSMAAPHVTGAIAVLADNFPELTGAQITRILKDTATDLGDPGVDPVYGHGLLNLKEAVAPQGNLSIPMGNSIKSQSIDLKDSWIAGDTATASALGASLAGSRVIAADKYNRGYRIDVNDAVLTPAGLSRAEMAGLNRFAAAAHKRQHTAPSQPASQVTVSHHSLDAEDEAIWPDAKAFGAAYGTFVDANYLGFSHDTGSAKIRFDAAANAVEGSYAATELTARLPGGHSLSIQAGRLRESGAILGTSVNGAFGVNLHTNTEFARFGSKLKLNDSTTIALSYATGTTSFASQGILAKGDDIKSSAIAIGVVKSGFLTKKDGLSIGLSRPLSIDAGKMTVDTPIALGAAENGVRSLTVHRQREKVNIRPADQITDLQIGYTTPGFGGGIGFGGVWRTGDKNGDKFGFSLSYGLHF